MNGSTLNSTLLIITLVLSLGALALSYINFKNTKSLNQLKSTFFAGKTGVELEHVLFSLNEQMLDLSREHNLTRQQLEKLRDHFRFSVQKVGLVKFNPFADVGGAFSFSLALLDEDNNGIVLTNMHGRERNRIYTKKITSGESETQLTEEEHHAVAIANQTPVLDKIKIPKQKKPINH